MALLSLLLVDDDEVDRLALKRGLARAGLPATITEAISAEEALALYRHPAPPNFDLALVDLHLPGEDGLELLRALRRHDERLPIIIMTGQGSEERAVELMKAGASDYLIKGTVSPTRLGQSIGQALALARQTRRRRAAEDALTRLADHLPDVVVRFDAELRHVHMNRPPPWTDLPVKALLGMRLTDLIADVAPSELSPLADALQRALRGESLTLSLELSDDFGDGMSRTTYEVRLVPEPPGESGPTVLALARDITAEHERKAEEARRLEFERQLMGIVSHDLKSPIAALTMVGDILGRELPDPSPRVARALELLAASSARAGRLITDILDFTRAHLGGGIPIARRLVDLGEVAEQIAAEVRVAHPGRQLVVWRSGDLSGRFDADRLAQVMANLLGNAVTYGHAEAPVTMAVEGHEAVITLKIQNRGPTLAAEDLARIFDPYQQVGQTGRGSVGLGLYIVRHLVEAHRGRLSVTSADQLTTFHITLPRQPVAAVHRAITLTA